MPPFIQRKQAIIKNITKSTISLINFIFKRSQESIKQKDATAKPIQTIDSIAVIQKDKVLFQPNTILTKTIVEFPSNKNPSVNTQAEIPINENDPSVHKIVLECNEAAIVHLEGLCRFFEINKFDAIARGIWLLSLARDIEINNKKLGIISIDQNGFVTDINPLNIV